MYARKHFTTAKSVVTIIVITLALSALGILGVTSLALAKKPDGGGGGEVGQIIAVCMTFDEVLAPTGTLTGIRSDDGAYCDGELRKKVTAIVGRNFDIQLETNNSNKTTAGRTVFLDLSNSLGCEGSVKVDVSDGAGGESDGICDDCVDSVPDLPTERFGTPSGESGYPDNAKLKILGWDLDGLLLGDTVETNARLSFSVDGQEWVLHWGPHKVPGGWTYAPGTDPVTVTRVDLDTWLIQSTGDSKTCLYRDNNPPHRATEYHGQVKVPFSVTAVAIEPEETVWGDEPHGIVLGDGPCVDGPPAPPAPDLNPPTRLTTVWGRIKADGE